MNNATPKITFSTFLSFALERQLSKLGCDIRNSTPRPGVASTLKDKADAWAPNTAQQLTALEPLLLSTEHSWIISPGTHNQIQLEAKNNESNRVVHRFTIRVSQKTSPVKQQTWLLNQSELAFDGTGVSGWAEAAEWVRDAWNAELKRGRVEWAACPEALTFEWQQTLLTPWANHLNNSQPDSVNSFIDSCIGQTDTYWLFKKPRFNLLSITPVSRSGRLHNGVELATPLTMQGKASLVQEMHGIFLNIPLSDGMSINGHVTDIKHPQGFAVQLTWTFVSSWTPGITHSFEFFTQ